MFNIQQDQIPQNEIDHIEDIMYELINKIKESEQTIHKLKESHRIEKEKNQKDTEILEQGLQKFIREHDQYHYKYPLKGALASYETGIYHSQTMSSNSLKTREESIAEVNLIYIFLAKKLGAFDQRRAL